MLPSAFFDIFFSRAFQPALYRCIFIAFEPANGFYNITYTEYFTGLYNTRQNVEKKIDACWTRLQELFPFRLEALHVDGGGGDGGTRIDGDMCIQFQMDGWINQFCRNETFKTAN